MTAHQLKLKVKKPWNRIADSLRLFAIEDYVKVEDMIKPQRQNEYKSFQPDCAFVFAQSNTYFFAINVAKDEKGYYHYGYELLENESGSSCYPSSRWRDHKKASTLKGCLLNALNHIKTMCKYYGKPPYALYVKTATEAIAKVNSSGVIQLSLFDFID